MTPPTNGALLASDHLEPLLRLARRAVRFWRRGLLAAVVVGGLALLATALLPKSFASEAVLFYREGIQWTQNEAVSPRRIGLKLKDMLMARTALTSLVQELDLYPDLVKAGRVGDAVEEMRSAIGFKFADGDVYVLSYRGRTAEEAQRVCAKLTEALVSQNSELRGHQAELASDFLDGESKRRAEDLAQKQAELLRFLAKHPEFAEEQTTGVGVSLRARSRRALEAAAAEPRDGGAALAALRREEERLRRQVRAGTEGGAQGQAAPREALAAALQDAEAKAAAAQRELADRRARFTEQHPDVVVALAQANAAERERKRAQDALDAVERPIPAGDAAERLKRVQGQIAEYERDSSRRSAAAAPVSSSPRLVAVETEWARLSRAVEESRERLEHVQNQKFTASMTASVLTAGQAGQLVLVDPANLPTRPLGMSLSKRAAVALALALGAALAVAFGGAYLDDVVYDAIDVERVGRGRVLAEVEGVGRRALAAASAHRVGEGGTAGTGGPARVRGDGGEASRSEARAFPQLVATSDLGGRAARASAVDVGPHAGSPERALARQPAVQIVAREPDGLRAAEFSFGSDFSDVVRIHRPPPPERLDEGLVMLAQPEGSAAASFRVLRHRISERPRVKTIMVTSPLQGEGKSYVAVNLALALGDAGLGRVLLLEANFRRPSIARLFQFEPALCIAQQFELRRAQVLEPWSVAEVVSPWLHVAAVAPGGDRSPLLDRRALVSCIADLQDPYDYIVVDCPAILEGAEANLVAESADGVIVTLSAKSSHGRVYRTAIDQLGAGKLLGVALVGA